METSDEIDRPAIRRDWQKLSADAILTLIESGDVSDIEELADEENDELTHFNNVLATGMYTSHIL